MKFDPFELERWLSESRLKVDFDLSASVITYFKYNELIGEKDLDVPIRIGPTNGSELLREEICKLYRGYVDIESILVTHGAAEGNLILLNHLIDPGDECIFFVPNYLQAYGVLKAIGAKIKLSHLDSNNEYRPDIEGLKSLVTRKTKAILLTNPNNPVGSIMTPDELKAICDIAQSCSAYVIDDEDLAGLEIEDKSSPTPIELYEKGIVTRSVSKLGMSGLRVGWIAARDPALIRGCWSIKDYTTLGNSFFNQHIAAVALKNLEKIKKRNRKLLGDRLAILEKWVDEKRDHLLWAKPKAGATALIRYKFNIDSIDFCIRLMRDASVALSPGDHFMEPRSFRMLFGTDEIRLSQALERIGQALVQIE